MLSSSPTPLGLSERDLGTAASAPRRAVYCCLTTRGYTSLSKTSIPLIIQSESSKIKHVVLAKDQMLLANTEVSPFFLFKDKEDCEMRLKALEKDS